MPFLNPPFPKRYNPVPVTISRLSLIDPPLDSDFNEPTGGQNKVYTNVVLEAQVTYNKRDEMGPSLAGNNPFTKGHLTFTKEYLESQSLTLTSIKIGDRVVDIAGIASDFKVMEVRPQGHLRGEAHLVFVFFGEDIDKYADVN